MSAGLLSTLLGRGNLVTVHFAVVRLTGTYESAALLEQIVYWMPRCDDEQSFVYKTLAEWQEELVLGEKSFRNARARLVELGLLETKIKRVLRGNSAVNLPALRINLERLEVLLKTPPEAQFAQTAKNTGRVGGDERATSSLPGIGDPNAGVGRADLGVSSPPTPPKGQTHIRNRAYIQRIQILSLSKTKNLKFSRVHSRVKSYNSAPPSIHFQNLPGPKFCTRALQTPGEKNFPAARPRLWITPVDKFQANLEMFEI